MTTIKASCPMCGDVELTPDQMRLVVCSYPDWSYYAFDCPHCKDEVRRHADDEVVTLLVTGGVLVSAWHIPEEVVEPRGGDPLTYDDLLDFVLNLATTQLLAAEAVGVAGVLQPRQGS
jgi:predicted RNA-binding Zn-ribbon protein involved in translation (DUF1610 family)